MSITFFIIKNWEAYPKPVFYSNSRQLTLWVEDSPEGA